MWPCSTTYNSYLQTSRGNPQLIKVVHQGTRPVCFFLGAPPDLPGHLSRPPFLIFPFLDLRVHLANNVLPHNFKGHRS